MRFNPTIATRSIPTINIIESPIIVTIINIIIIIYSTTIIYAVSIIAIIICTFLIL